MLMLTLTGCTPNIEGKYVMYQNYDKTPSITINDSQFISNYPKAEEGNYKCPYKFTDNKITLDDSNVDNQYTKDIYMHDYIYCDDEDFDFIYATDYITDGMIPDTDYFDVTLTDVKDNTLQFDYVFTESGVYEEYSIIGTRRSLFSQGTYKRDGNFLIIKSENTSYVVNSPVQTEQYYYIKDNKLYTKVYVKCS